MTDKDNTETTSETPTENKTVKTSFCAGAGCNHLPLIVAFIALLLAAFAIISNQSNVSSGALETRLQQLDDRLTGINQRIDSMEIDVASNRENLVKNQLKKLLINIQEISSMAAEETRRQLAQVESLLQDITRPASEEPTAPEVAPAAEQAAPADNSTTAEPEGSGNADNTDIPSVELQAPDNMPGNTETTTPAEAATSGNAL